MQASRAMACLGIAAGCLLGLLGWSRSALAGDPAVAEQLFVQGKEAMARHDYVDACAKFKASREQDVAATGTLLNLANCHELLHMNASAWAEFRQVAAESRDRREDRVKLATEGEARLFPLLDHLTVTIAPGANFAGLAMTIDDEPFATASLGIRIPMNPGHHVLVASAKGMLTARYDIELGEARDERRLEIAPLVAESTRSPVLGYAVGGAGLVVLSGGIVTGVLALQTRHDANTTCGSCQTGSPEADTAHGQMNTARTLATVADVLVPLGAIATAVGAYFVLTSRSGRSDRSARIVPGLSSAIIEGTF